MLCSGRPGPKETSHRLPFKHLQHVFCRRDADVRIGTLPKVNKSADRGGVKAKEQEVQARVCLVLLS